MTKHFFKDRDKTALTPSGQRKRIIHFVNAHERVRDGKRIAVKEHIRGLRIFTWRGFECAVTAPAFHQFVLQDFEVGAFADNDVKPGETTIPLDILAGRLAKYEDQQTEQARAKVARPPA